MEENLSEIIGDTDLIDVQRLQGTMNTLDTIDCRQAIAQAVMVKVAPSRFDALGTDKPLSF